VSTPLSNRVVMKWVLWIALVLVLATPGFMYILLQSLPSDNVLSLDPENAYLYMYPIYMAWTNALLPVAAQWLDGKNRCAPKILIGRVLNTLVLPIVLTLYLDHGCFQGFMSFWNPCQLGNGSLNLPSGCPFNVTEYTGSGLAVVHQYSCVTLQEDVCTKHFQAGKCSRRVVELLGLVWAQMLAIAASIEPMLSLCLSPHCVQMAVVRPLRRLRGCDDVPKLDLHKEWAILLSQIELIVCVGPFVPILVPLGIVALWLRSLVLRFHCQIGLYSNGCLTSLDDLQPCNPPFGYLWLSNLLLAAFGVCFFVVNQLYGGWMVCLFPAIGILVAFRGELYYVPSHLKHATMGSQMPARPEPLLQNEDGLA